MRAAAPLPDPPGGPVPWPRRRLSCTAAYFRRSVNSSRCGVIMSDSVRTPTDAKSGEEAAEVEELLVGELLVEDVSIDGMCGVY